MLRKISIVLASLLAVASIAWAQTPKPKASLLSETTANLPDNTNYAIAPAIMRGVLNDMIASWQQYAAVNAQVGTSYTFQQSDYGQLVSFNNSSTISALLPQPTGSFYPFNVYLINLGAGTLIISATGGTINSATTLSLGTNQTYWLLADGTGTNYRALNLTGALVTVSNSDGSLTVSPTVGNVIASLNPAHANTWTALQQFNDADLALKGSASGAMTLHAPAAADSSNLQLPVIVSDTVAVLGLANQTLSGGANVTAYNIGTITSSVTPSCGNAPLQYMTVSGSITLNAPTADGSCIIRMTNSTSAGIIISGFTVGGNTGDSYVTTSTDKFDFFIRRINGIASYAWSALQ